MTWWLFAFGAMALAAPADRPRLGAPGRLTRVVAALGCLVRGGHAGARLPLADPARRRGQRASRPGNCPAAIDAALDSAGALGVRPEPFEVLGFCDSQLGFADLAAQALRNAIERDRDNWDFEYGLALVNAANGRNPHPALRRALDAQPAERRRAVAIRRLAGNNPRRWRRIAPTLTLPIQ